MALDLLTPIGLGLLGFVEPCSLGANAVFLSYVVPLSGWRRVAEALTFTVSRGVFLGLIGAVAGAAGGPCWRCSAGTSWRSGWYLSSWVCWC